MHVPLCVLLHVVVHAPGYGVFVCWSIWKCAITLSLSSFPYIPLLHSVVMRYSLSVGAELLLLVCK